MSESLSMGSFQLTKVPVSYSISGGESDQGSNGLLGNEVLSRFNLVFDYPNERMFLTPNQNFSVPLTADRSGLLLRPHQSGAVVKSIAVGSAGDGSNLRVGDIITRFDDKALTRLNIADLKRVLGSDRETVSVCWLSGAQPRCGNLELSSRFNL
jgi:hypothetical protein